jgi:NAD-dependent DNA ligase
VSTFRNFRITIEQPRELVTKNDKDIVVDTFTTFVYGVRNQAEVRDALTQNEKLKQLRKQGLRITKPQMKKANLVIERI